MSEGTIFPREKVRGDKIKGDNIFYDTGIIYIYIYTVCHQKKFVIERTRDLIYLKFVATDFSPKISSPSTGENSGDSA